MAPNKPSGSSKPKVASAGATLAKGYRRDAPHPNANLKQDDDTSTLSDTTHESTQLSPVAAMMDATDNAADDMNNMKPAAINKEVEGEESEQQIWEADEQRSLSFDPDPGNTGGGIMSPSSFLFLRIFFIMYR